VHEGEDRVAAALSVVAEEAGGEAESRQERCCKPRFQADDDKSGGDQLEQADRPGDKGRGRKTQFREIGGSSRDVAKGGDAGGYEQEGHEQPCGEENCIGRHKTPPDARRHCRDLVILTANESALMEFPESNEKPGSLRAF
jgi:hypothetical protein